MVKQVWQYLQLFDDENGCQTSIPQGSVVRTTATTTATTTTLLVIIMDQVSQSLVSYLYWFCDNYTATPGGSSTKSTFESWGTRYWCSTTFSTIYRNTTTNNVPGSPDIPATGTTDIIRESTTVSHTVTGNGNTGVPMNPNPALTTSTSSTGATILQLTHLMKQVLIQDQEAQLILSLHLLLQLRQWLFQELIMVLLPRVKIQLVAATLMDLLLPPIQGGNNEPGNQPSTNTTGEPVGTTDTQSVELISQPTTLSQQTTSSLISTPLASTFDGSGSIVQYSAWLYVLLTAISIFF